MRFPFPLAELKDWLNRAQYGATAGVPAFTSPRVCPVQNWRFERRLRRGRPVSLGVHSHPRSFREALPHAAGELYDLFYLHHRVEADRSWPELIDNGLAQWQLSAVSTPGPLRYILSSIRGRSPGEFVYLGDDSGLLIEESWRLLQGRGAGRALDLCCGCGVVGLGLPAGWDAVVGLDFNETAVELAQVNAELNGVPGYEARVSDMWEAGEGWFDFVVGNPPALPLRGEQRKLLYAYGGEQPASLTLLAVEGLQRHLAPGGVAVFLSFSVRDQLWDALRQELGGEFSLDYRPRRRLQLADPQLGWMEHVWVHVRRDSRGERRRLPMSWSDRLESFALPWAGEPPLQACYAGNQRS
jgi:methylase of polypeptide subunit release factors